MNHSDNKHCTETPYSCRYHYKRNGDYEQPCGVNDDPTRVKLLPKATSWPSLEFEIPRQHYDLDKVEQLMGHAYRRGQTDKMAEIREMFKMVIGL